MTPAFTSGGGIPRLEARRNLGPWEAALGAWSWASSESPTASQPDFLRPRSGRLHPPAHLPRVTPSHPASLWRGQEGVWPGGAAGMSLHVLVGKAVRSWCGRNSREGPRDGAACAGLICGTVVAHSSQKGEQLCRGPASLQDSERPCTPPPNTSHHVTGMTEGQPRRPGHALPLTDPCGLHSSSGQHSPQGDAGGQPLEASREARGQRAALGLRSQSVQVAACVAPARLLASALGRL